MEDNTKYDVASALISDILPQRDYVKHGRKEILQNL